MAPADDGAERTTPAPRPESEGASPVVDEEPARKSFRAAWAARRRQDASYELPLLLFVVATLLAVLLLG